MTRQSISGFMKQIRAWFSLFRRIIAIGLIAAFSAASMAGCNGKIFESLEGKDKDNMLLFLLFGRKYSDVFVTSIQSNPRPGGYGITADTGAELPVIVTFSDNVIFSKGRIDVRLSTGQTVQITAPTDEFEQRNTSFTGFLTITEGMTTEDEKLNAVSIRKVRASIVDTVENLSVRVALPPAGNNIGDQEPGIYIDGIRPIITSVASSSTGDIPGGTVYSTGASIDITLNFSKRVTLNGNPTDHYLEVTLNPLNGYPPPPTMPIETLKIANIGGVTSVSTTYLINNNDSTSGDHLVVTGIAAAGSAPYDDAGNYMTVFTFPSDQNIDDNDLEDPYDSKYIIIDGTSPSIKSVSTTAPNNTYGIGSAIPVTIEFFDATELTAGGGMDLTLDSGGVVHIAPFALTVGPHTASGTYTVASGNTSADLEADSFTLLGGSVLQNSLGYPFVSGIPDDNFSASNIVIDGVRPTILSARSTTASGLYGSGDIVNVTLTFSEPVMLTGAGGLDVTLNATNGGSPIVLNIPVAALSGYASSVSVNYNVAVGDTTGGSDLSVSGVALAGTSTLIDDCDTNPNTMTDFAVPTNMADAGAAQRNIEIDGILPTITGVACTTGDGRYGIGSTLNIRLQFSKAVTLAGGTLDVTLNATNGGTPLEVSFDPADFSGTLANKTFTVSTGDMTPNVAAPGNRLSASGAGLSSGATLVDAAGNNADLNIPADNNIEDTANVIVDGILPTIASVTSATPPNGTYGTGSNIAITVNFSEPVTLTGTGGLALTLNAVNGVTPVVVTIPTFGTPVSSASVTYTVSAGDVTGSLGSLVELDVSGAALTGTAILSDACTVNPNAMAVFTIPGGQNFADSNEIFIDGILPAVSMISSTTASGEYGYSSVINITLGFNRNVILNGLNGMDVTLNAENGGTPITVNVPSFGPADTTSATFTVAYGDTTSAADLSVTGIALGAGSTLVDTVANNPNAIAEPITLPAGQNIADNTTDPKSIDIDGVQPTITEINSGHANGTFGTGENIEVTLTFSKPVTLAGGGTLDIELDTGGLIQISTINNSTTATGTYIVAAGQSSPDLNVSDIQLNGATLRDQVATNANDADLAIPTGENLADNRAIVIDAIRPVITSIESSTDPGRYGIGSTINVRINFSKPVTLSGTALVATMDTGGTATDTAISGDYFEATYTVASPQNSADLNVTSVDLDTATLRDAYGNDADLTLPAGQNLADNEAIVVDTTAPTISSVTSTSDNGLYGTGGTIDITINFSEPIQIVDGAGGIQVTLNAQDGGGTPITVTLYSGDVSGSSASTTYTVAPDDTTSSVDLTATGITGTGGAYVRDLCDENFNTLTDYSIPAGQNIADLKDIQVYGTTASISSITSSTADGRYGETSTINVTVNFGQSVTLSVGTLDLTLNSGASVSIDPFVGSSGSVTYTVAGGQNSADLAVSSIALGGGATLVTTSGSNPVDISVPGANFSTKNIIVDTTAPTIAYVTSSTANNTYGVTATIDVTVYFSEPVTLSGGNLEVTLETGTSDAIVTIAPFTNAGSASGTYTVAVGHTSPDLTVNTIALGSGASLVDTAANTTHAMTDFSIPGGSNLADNKAIVIDAVQPTITSITSTTDNGTYGINETVNLTINFSKDVVLTGANGMNVTINSTGTVQNIPSFALAGSAQRTYTVALNDTTSGADLTVTNIQLGSGSTLLDAYGNSADLTLPATQNLANTKDIIIDAVRPTITSITSTSTSPQTYGAGQSINITINFSKSVALVGANGLNLTINATGTVQNIPAFALAGSAQRTYTVAVNDTTSGADLTVTNIQLGSGSTLLDAYGNSADLTLPPAQNLADTRDIQVDGVRPYITEITTSTPDDTYGVTDTVNVTLTFSKDVVLAGANGLNVTINATGTDQNIPAFALAGSASFTYTVAVNDTTSGADLDVMDIQLGSGSTLLDAYGNVADLTLPSGDNLADNSSIIIDGVLPYITSVTSSTTNGTYAVNDNINITVNFSKAVALSTGTLDVVLNSGYTLHIPAFSSSTSASATYTVAAGQTTSGADLNATSPLTASGGVIVDGAGNSPANLDIPVSYNIADLKNIIIDAVAPTISSAETLDTDGDGHIDYYRITFSKAIRDESFPGCQLNSVGFSQTDWSVAGHTGTSIVMMHGTAVTFETDTPNDAVIYVRMNELSSYDTGSTPNVTTSATPGVRDTISTTGNPLAQVGTDTVIESDKAAPIIVTSSGATGTTAMTITFSEPVDQNGSAGGCNDFTSIAAYVYSDNSGGGVASISSLGGDVNTYADNNMNVILNTTLTTGDLAPTPDRIHAATGAILDMNDNPASDARNVAVTGAVSPYVLGVTSTGATTIQITFSEAVVSGTGATGAQNFSNYALIEDPVQSGCSGTGSDTVNIDTGTPIAEITPGLIYQLTTDADQCSTTTYRLTVSNVVDVNDGVVIASPNYGTFLGNERLKIAAATCNDDYTMTVQFNKPVASGTGTGGSEATNRYKFTGGRDLGTIDTATRGTTINSWVTLTHSLQQYGISYTVIGSNGIDGDGFNDAAIGSIQIVGLTQSLQAQPNDRALWTGCGPEINDFDDGPITIDPFGDASVFGYLATYHGQLYIGPNQNGNMANRFNPDGTNPVNCLFTFNEDTSTANGTGTHENTASTRDGGIAVPPFVTIGHTGCTTGTADINTGCGPDNENGRGLFVNGTIGGTEYLFITGGKSSGNNDYLYQTTDSDTTLDFSFVDLSATFDSDSISGNRGTESIVVFNNKVFWMEPGNQSYRPYFVKLNNLNAQSINNTDSVWMRIRYMTGVGQHSSSKPAYADRLGGTLFGFNDRLYMANTGSVRDVTGNDWNCAVGQTGSRCANNGGLIRTTTNDPGRCSSADNCDWTDITPTSAKFTYYFSRIIDVLADILPANRPFPAFAEYKGNLYMIRNACTTNMVNRGCDPGSSPCTDDVTCPVGNEVPQLWKCDPTNGGSDTTNPTTCEAGEWTIIAENGTTGGTNMGDTNNTHITMLITNGNYLYVGFDNTSTGLEIWRTNADSPTSAAEFAQIGGNGLGTPARYLRNFSAVSIAGTGEDTGYYFLYLSAGDNTQPLAVFRQRND
ncbi:MAG: hypothetical protein JW807_13785 [Spirochaetes bacterium]|nr:hypothetical protein [Spirochaetota bacterium]